MIRIEKATVKHTDILADMGRTTYEESHGQYIQHKKDLLEYLNNAFSVAKTKQELIDSKNLFFLVYYDDTPVGYSKLILESFHETVPSQNACRLERIYILNEFIPLKIGHRLLRHVEQIAKDSKFDTIWLSVYINNIRAIKFYERNKYKNVGKLNFLVNGQEYENDILAKSISE